mgnify:CR=1 FL=1
MTHPDFGILSYLLTLIGITGTMVYFAVRYSRRRHPQAENIEGNLALEITWTIIPTLLVLAIFWVGWKGFVVMRTVPDDAMTVIDPQAKQVNVATSWKDLGGFEDFLVERLTGRR